MIKIVVFDFDGVFTDNHVYVDSDGKETVMCSRDDGIGLEMLRTNGITPIVLSSESNAVVQARCKKLDVPCFSGIRNKLEKLRNILTEMNIVDEGEIRWSEVAYVGNDINDFECMATVGLPIAVQDANIKAIYASKKVLDSLGGYGAVREACEYIVGRSDGR